MTGDGASFQNAPKGQRKCTSFFLILLGTGVLKEYDWGGLVSRLASKVHSCINMFPVCVWMGSDDAKHCKEHMLTRMQETSTIEGDGMLADLPGEMPPWDLVGGVLRKRALEEATPKKKGRTWSKWLYDPVRRVRAVLVTRIRIWPRFMWAFDGATTNAIGGVTHQSKHSDVFSDEKTDEMGSFHLISTLRKGKSLADLAEDLAPGCSDPAHRAHDLLEYLAKINRHSRNSELQAVTREPERRKEAERTQGIGNQARRAANVFANPAMRDGRTVTELPYLDEDLVRLGYNHAGFVPGVNGDVDGIVDEKVFEDVLVRVPVRPKHGRSLPKAIWAGNLGEHDEQSDVDEDEQAPPKLFTFRFGMCMLHGAMRTIESCLKHMLFILSNQFKEGRHGDRGVIDTHLNDYLLVHLKIRRLITLNDKGELNKIQINGTEAKRLMEDVVKGEDSILLQAVKRTYANLKHVPDESTTQVGRWAEVLRQWGLAMNAAFVTRAGDDERRTFAKHARLYVMEKSCIRSGITTWYDWQLYSMLPRMFYTYGSLYAICQEGMEATQKSSGVLMRMSSKFANVGRVPIAIIRAGKDALVAFMRRRLQNVKTPEQFLFLRQLCSFYANHYDKFKHVTELKQSGKAVDWQTEHVPSWRSFVCISIIYRICAAKRSWDEEYSSRAYG